MNMQTYRAAAEYITARLPKQPQIAVVLGSALGALAETVAASADSVTIDYGEIPHFLRSTAPYQAGKLVCGTFAGKYIACFSGRFHHYEGYSDEQLAIPVRVMKLMGIETLILTNAAGAVNKEYRVGDIMVVCDHIKLMGDSPARGENYDELGPRFFDMSEAYTPALRRLALDCAQRLGQGERTREGVYFYTLGPQYETPAEIRAIRLLGGDAVGMSTVTETITASHCGMQVLALSVMTNMAAGVLPQRLTSEEVGAAGVEASERFIALLEAVIGEMNGCC